MPGAIVQAEYHEAPVGNDNAAAIARRYAGAGYKANLVLTDLVVAHLIDRALVEAVSIFVRLVRTTIVSAGVFT